MNDYYQILGIKQDASQAEIKSAYRKLARKSHPDLNPNTQAAREFDVVSKAYQTLSDPHERAYYDEQLRAEKDRGYSILDSNNKHAKRARNIAVQAKWDRLVDEVLEQDRRENRERQRAVFTTVSLFLSTFFLALLRPQFWSVFDYLGRAIVLTLFVIGVWHLATRLREYFAHYTYQPKPIQESIIREETTPEQPYTRFSAYTFLLIGYVVSIGIGLYLSWHFQGFLNGLQLFFERKVVQTSFMASTSSAVLISDLIVLPPIAVLIVDTVHSVVSRMDQ